MAPDDSWCSMDINEWVFETIDEDSGRAKDSRWVGVCKEVFARKSRRKSVKCRHN